MKPKPKDWRFEKRTQEIAFWIGVFLLVALIVLKSCSSNPNYQYNFENIPCLNSLSHRPVWIRFDYRGIVPLLSPFF